MEKYYDLEKSIMACVLIKPELMEKLIIDDKYMIKHKRIWSFIRATYKKWGTLDLTLMFKIIKDKYHFVEYMKIIMDSEVRTSQFINYQKQLMEMYDEERKEKYLREKIYDLANELYVKKIDAKAFRIKLDEIYSNANKLYDEGGMI